MTTEILTVDSPQLKAWEISKPVLKVIPTGTLIAVVRKISVYSGPETYEVHVSIKPNEGASIVKRIPVASPEAGIELISKKMS